MLKHSKNQASASAATDLCRLSRFTFAVPLSGFLYPPVGLRLQSGDLVAFLGLRVLGIIRLVDLTLLASAI